MKNKTPNEIIITTQDTPIEVPNTEAETPSAFHSNVEKFFVGEIMKVDLKEAKKELDRRVIVQHKDSKTNIPCFNATARRVLVQDENGQRIIINNQDEIRKQQMKNRIAENKTDKPNISNTSSNDGDEIEFED